MSYWYDDDKWPWGPPWARVLLVGVLAGAIAVGLAWWGTSWFGSPDPTAAHVLQATPTVEDSTGAGASEDIGDEHPSESAHVSDAMTPLARCQDVYEKQSAPLKAAAASLAQWEVHIGAMNQLVTGAISLRQARQFWSRTRVGAHAKLHEFAHSHRPYEHRAYRCAAPSNAKANRALERCHLAVAARGRTLRLASTSLDRWNRHVHHMEMLRSGDLTAQRATQLWLRDWRAGDREVRAYRSAARAGRGLTC